MLKKIKVKKIINILSSKYPEATTALNYDTIFELLIATILSAQTTDKQVNKLTTTLFQKYNTPEDFAYLDQEVLEKEINSIGLYHNKSKYIIKSSKIILEKYNGRVPGTRQELIKLPGVGRKTANVILATAFEKAAIAVDTHVFRVSNRLGLAKSDKVNEVEQQLMDIIPEDKWIEMHHYLIFHGREVCKARKPICSQCDLNDLCKYYTEKQKEINIDKQCL